MSPEQQLVELEKQLSQLYLGVADKYKQMSKVKDSHRIKVMLSAVDDELKHIAEVRSQIEVLRKRIFRTLEKNSAHNTKCEQ